MMKKKRGRPRILDAPGEVNPFAQTRLPDPGSLLAGSISGGTKAATTMPSSSLDLVTSTKNTPEINDDNSNEPTPGGPLTNDRIKELGIIKMNDYLSTGTRQQFWEEYYVKVVMQVNFFEKDCLDLCHCRGLYLFYYLPISILGRT